jgi:hypothetical protein
MIINNKNMDIKHLNLITEYSKGVIKREQIVEQNGEYYSDLLDSYLNDLNSSRLRQDIACHVLGLKVNDNKLGYDSDGSNDEIKPKNISSKSLKKNKLDCGGSYSDLTHKRHAKYIIDNAIIHSAGFIDGHLMYIIKVPYIDLQEHFKKILNDKLPDGDLPNRYVRSASFGFKQIKNCPNAEVEFVRSDIENYYLFIGKELYNYIKEL